VHLIRQSIYEFEAKGVGLLMEIVCPGKLRFSYVDDRGGSYSNKNHKLYRMDPNNDHGAIIKRIINVNITGRKFLHMTKRFNKKWLWTGFSFILIFIALQFVGEPLKNPPVTAFIQAPDSVQSILIRSCYNCHSNITNLSWYDRIAPASWLVKDHVLEGRRRLNFSEWDSLNKTQQKAALFECLNQMQFQTMPLGQYVLLHPSSKLSPEDVLVIRNYLSSLLVPVIPDTAKYTEREKQFVFWQNKYGNTSEVKPSPNGITFYPDYKNWVVISSSERFDNGTLRAIVGNEIAMKAIKAYQTNPWPDGSVLAKIAWYSLADSSGNLFPGEFKQVEFMVKDKKKYSDTEGWGFARWVNGLKLDPYGKDPLFTTECVNCHRPMEKNDFVFTEPVDLNAEKRSEGKLISFSVNRKDQITTIFYGNDRAATYARTHPDHNFPDGSMITAISWKQKEDDHWYGARLTGQIKSVVDIRLTDYTTAVQGGRNKFNPNHWVSILP
jgi:Haem-binding domain/Cytochrome P460